MGSMEILLLHQEKKVFTYSLLIMLLLSNIKFLQQLLELHFLLDASDNGEGIQWNLEDSICSSKDNPHSRGGGNFLKNDLLTSGKKKKIRALVEAVFKNAKYKTFFKN